MSHPVMSLTDLVHAHPYLKVITSSWSYSLPPLKRRGSGSMKVLLWYLFGRMCIARHVQWLAILICIVIYSGTSGKGHSEIMNFYCISF